MQSGESITTVAFPPSLQKKAAPFAHSSKLASVSNSRRKSHRGRGNRRRPRDCLRRHRCRLCHSTEPERRAETASSQRATRRAWATVSWPLPKGVGRFGSCHVAWAGPKRPSDFSPSQSLAKAQSG